jgi:hypothetical protein
MMPGMPAAGMPAAMPGQAQQMAGNPMTQFNPGMMQQNPQQAAQIMQLLTLLGGLGRPNPMAPGLQAPAPSPKPGMPSPGIPQMPQASMPPGVPMGSVFGGPRA